MENIPEIEHYDILVIGSGEAGEYLVWTFAKAGRRTASVEGKMVGGSCPNVTCLPSKNVIHNVKVASLAALFYQDTDWVESDRILGIAVFGAEASETMATVQTAMLGELPFTVLRDAIFTYPTTTEGLSVILSDAAASDR